MPSSSDGENTELLNDNVYKVIKCPLKNLLKNYSQIQPIIEKAVLDINQLVILCYEFVRLFVLNKYINGLQIPNINKQFILDVFKIIGICNDNRGKKTKVENIKYANNKNEIKEFYVKEFRFLHIERISYTNKTFILEQTSRQIAQSIENNIKSGFIKSINKYINCLFKIPISKIIKEEKDKEKKKLLYKNLNAEIRNLKYDLFNNIIEKSDKKYHDWINKNKTLLFPSHIIVSAVYDLEVNPMIFLQHFIYINEQIDNLGFKPHQIIPQRNNIIPKNITLNTYGIIDLIDDKEKNIFNYSKSELLYNGKKHQKHIWSKILKLEKRSIFNNKKYV